MREGDYDRRDALPEGTVLREYTLKTVLGHGGFGIVYQALHNELRLPVAIKEFLPIELAVREGSTVRPRRGADSKDFESSLRRFRDEARALVQLRGHEHIVSCRDFFRGNGTAYFVMDYEDGLSLAEVLAKREAEGRPFEESDLLAVMIPLLEGLTEVHETGLLHRDIKPSNILIRRWDERPVLIDFGAAKQVVAKHSKSMAPYTEGYAAPEQLDDAGVVGPWTDVYGAGAVMWRMVAGGRPPWEPPNPVRVESRALARIRGAEDPLPAASELGRGRFSARTLEVIDRCLQLHEKERFQGCLEVHGALEGPSLDAPSHGSPIASAHPAKRIAQVPGHIDAGASTGPEEESRGKRRIALASLAAGFVLGLGLAHWGVDLDGDALGWLTTGSSPKSPSSTTDRGSREPDPPANPGRRFRDCEACPEMVEVPTGSFVMGSPAAEEGRDRSEWPMHQVEIAYRLAVGVYEVTFQEWDACVDNGGCSGYVPDDEGWGHARRPVLNLARNFVQRYIDWLIAVTGREYRLLSEAEWEYVARAGTRTAYHFGDEIPPRLANFGENAGKTVEVGSYPANAFGLYDVHGNVAEWVSDCWHDSYLDAPSDGSAWMTDDCDDFVVRGGSWKTSAIASRSAARLSASRFLPYHASDQPFGFRVARTLIP